MNTPNRAIVVKITELVSLFPQREIEDATVLAYAARLSKYPEDLVLLACDYLCDRSEWFPTVSQILDAAGVGLNDSPPFVLPIGPSGNPVAIALWRARLVHGQQLRFDRDKCPRLAPADPTERLIWLKSIDRREYPEYFGSSGIGTFSSEVAALEHQVGVPQVKAVGSGMS
jgi:hypothetical protein